jgi:predicted nucleic acid-binding Zn ribbon protein
VSGPLVERTDIADSRPPRHCYKCGREIGPDESICEICNRAGMATPSATQYHGTIVVAIVLGVALMAVGASLAMRGIGPYQSRVVAFHTVGQGQVAVSVALTNEGSRAGRASCKLTAQDDAGRPLAVTTAVSPQVESHGSATFPAVILGVEGAPAMVSVSCH